MSLFNRFYTILVAEFKSAISFILHALDFMQLAFQYYISGILQGRCGTAGLGAQSSFFIHSKS